MRKCSLDKVNEILARLSNEMSVYLPVDDSNGRAHYKKWQEGDKWSLKVNTERSAKDFFFPQTEDLVKFKTQGKDIEIIDVRDEKEDYVIFGVKACDEKSFEILDRVFLSEPVDTFYKSRREHGVIFSIACDKMSETCFCNVFNIDASSPAGDVTMFKDSKNLYFKANTEKGENVLSKVEDLLIPADEKEVAPIKENIKKTLDRLSLKDLDTKNFGAGKTKEFFDSPLWKEMSSTCLGCGTCTFICPTCQCYDIKEFNTGNGVVRFRCWDSCMYSDFTKMAHGNPRTSQAERFRQRFMHKLVYYPENNDGIMGCVGCGRCLAKCPISMNIVKVMKKLGGSENE